MFPKSPSTSSLDKEYLYNDSNYSKEFNQQRNSRTLSMRRNNLLTIANFKKTESSREFNHNNNGSDLLSSLKSETQQIITLENFIEIFNSGDVTKTIQLSDMLIKIAKSSSKDLQNSLKNITQSKEAGESFGMALSITDSENLLHSLLTSLIFAFPMFSQEAQEEIVNGGVALKVDEILSNFVDKCSNNSCTCSDVNLLIESCMLITILSKHSSYARDSFLCYSVHERLLNMLTAISSSVKQYQSQIHEKQLDAQSNQILNSLAEAVQSIYVTKLNLVDDLGDQITDKLINQMIQLVPILYNINLFALKSIMSCLISIISSYTSVVDIYFDNNLDSICFSMLKNPELTSLTLSLLGNMCATGDPKRLLPSISVTDEHPSLFQILVEMIPTEFSADVFWIMSSLFDNLPGELMNYITTEFIQYIISIGCSSGYQVKKESAFFLATVITKVSASYIPKFAESAELIDTLIEMLGCGENKVVIRCIYAISYIIRSVESIKGKEAVLMIFSDTELVDQIENLKEEHGEIIPLISCLSDSTFDSLLNNSESL